ncbi:hypothetical protein FIBSPDRAFT_471750 [Athelia psychrophila]|uniref:Uncharacterized protein n=1 Tax=Athelia psychrophila TaxID=1759441 RepID=A0A166LB27_9AGAM|nr:hypothetical protein FIBSPDRAFT_471750 [Fibularhizoctonia sp. CBS 109695]
MCLQLIHIIGARSVIADPIHGDYGRAAATLAIADAYALPPHHIPPTHHLPRPLRLLLVLLALNNIDADRRPAHTPLRHPAPKRHRTPRVLALIRVPRVGHDRQARPLRAPSEPQPRKWKWKRQRARERPLRLALQHGLRRLLLLHPAPPARTRVPRRRRARAEPVHRGAAARGTGAVPQHEPEQDRHVRAAVRAPPARVGRRAGAAAAADRRRGECVGGGRGGEAAAGGGAGAGGCEPDMGGGGDGYRGYCADGRRGAGVDAAQG